jgi:hypothetical protein
MVCSMLEEERTSKPAEAFGLAMTDIHALVHVARLVEVEVIVIHDYGVLEIDMWYDCSVDAFRGFESGEKVFSPEHLCVECCPV